MLEKVSVLLSSFNGEAYLAEQLDSLVRQSYPNVSIYVRDDSSTDDTRRILEGYEARFPNLHLTFGERLGISGSFFYLLRHSGDDAQYFAFCDQDDVWSPDKIARAVSRLSGVAPGTPALYCSQLEYVDRELNHLRFSRLPRRELRFENALVENYATGCSVVLNRAARDVIVERLPADPAWHDWWCYLVVAAFGVVLYDPAPGLKYRLHDANDTGAAVSVREQLGRRLRRFSLMGRAFLRIHAQAQQFHRLYADRLGSDKGVVLERFLASKRSFLTRLRFALFPVVYRQTRLDDLGLRVLILCGWY